MLVKFSDVVKTYGSGEAMQTAVDHVDFTIDEGEFVVILGQVWCRKIYRFKYAWRNGYSNFGYG